ncbi:6-phosphogluconolactonase [Janibacter sp. GXQ6167]|uniref:6-phosphogluconolactonase n=1 Tax=Janibacter sp. GXQ6167 TaxID=3240791 RepID=UPI0035232C78
MSGIVMVHPSRAQLARATGMRLVLSIQAAQAERGWAEVGLTGGSMGSAVVAAAYESGITDCVDWTKVGIWWGDERYLPAGEPDRNDTQNDEAGLSLLGIPPEHIHRVQGPDESGSLEDAAAAYEAAIREHGRGAFDITLLGVGPDGHVASLFPGHPMQLADDAIALAVTDSPKPPSDRVSLSLEALRRSREVWFVVSGEDKAQAVVDGVGEAPPSKSTASQVSGTERTLWLVDPAAASGL